MADSILTSDAETIDTGVTIQAIITFTKFGGAESFSFDDKGLVVTNWGTLEWDYDLEETLIVPGSMEIEISDKDLWLHDILFFNALYQTRFTIELKLTGTTEFLGDVNEDTIFYDYGERILKFRATPQIDIINKRMAYDEDNATLNPFSYTFNGATYEAVTDVIEDIYGLVDSGVTVDYSHNWVFNASNEFATYAISNAVHAAGS